jgi:arylsulfatase A-like enzyme
MARTLYVVFMLSILGGYPKFVERGLNENYLPVWLQDAGYRTYYTGKLFNSHSVDNYDKPFPNGFTANDYLLDPTTYQYLNATIQTNRDPPVSYAGQYSTDVIAEKTLGYIDDAAAAQKPFFIVSSPIAPHSEQGDDILSAAAPIPAERHKDLFKDAIVPRTPSFNPEKVTFSCLDILEALLTKNLGFRRWLGPPFTATGCREY